MQHRGEPLARAPRPAACANGSPLSLMRCLARLIRRVMVASGTRNARAISAVVSPPTARRVSAICEAGDSDGWQHRNSRMSVSSDVRRPAGRPAGASHCSGRIHRATASSRRRRACSLRSRSVSRRDGDRDQPAARVVRDAVARPLRGGREQRLLHRVLGGVEVPVAAHQRAEDLRRQLAQQVLDAVAGTRGQTLQVGPAPSSDRPDVDVRRRGRRPDRAVRPAGRRSRWPGRSCRTRRSSSRRGPPGSRRTGRR